MGDARRRAFADVKETCPGVDRALSDAADAIKELTGELRDALIQAHERIIELEGEVADLNKRLEAAECELAEASRG